MIYFQFYVFLDLIHSMNIVQRPLRLAETYRLLEDLYVFFSRSCKQDTVLRDHMKQFENTLKLRNLSKTRWVYRSESIEAAWSSFEAVRKALKEVSEKDKHGNARTKAVHEVDYEKNQDPDCADAESRA